MATIIDGKKLAKKIKDNIVKETVRLGSKRPNLAIILIGEKENSKLYVSLKEKEARKVGIDTHLYKCSEDISEQEVLEMISCLNKDKQIDAILIQMPLPAGFDTDGIIRAIDPAKDVDRFHPDNLEILFKTCDHAHVMPPVFSAVLAILKDIKCEIKDKQVCVLANSDIFGKSLAKVLACQGASCQVLRSDNEALARETGQADILITAIGQPKFIKRNMIKKEAVIIDIGITKKGKKVYGDVDLDDVKDKAGYITPVPEGVGPMTVAMTLKNTLELYKRRHKEILI